MSEFLHNLRLREEVLRIHGARLERLYRHRSSVVPQTFPHLTELTLSQLPQEFQRRTIDFPLVPRTVTEAFRYGFLNLLNKARPGISRRRQGNRYARFDFVQRRCLIVCINGELYFWLAFCLLYEKNSITKRKRQYSTHSVKKEH